MPSQTARIDDFTKQFQRLFISGLAVSAIALGGTSAPFFWGHLVLQLAAVVLLFTMAFNDTLFRVPRHAERFGLITIVIAAVALAQLLPLPGFFRGLVQGGDVLKRGFELIGERMGFMPVSVSPAATWRSLLDILLPMAVFLLMMKVSWKANVTRIVWVLPAMGLISVFLGVLQVATGGDESAYFYSVSSFGLPAGLFAHVEHQATFLLMCLPIAAILASQVRNSASVGDTKLTLIVAVALGALILLGGVFLTRSIAAYVLLAPTVALCVLIVQQRRREVHKSWRVIIPATAVIGLGVVHLFVVPVSAALGWDLTEGGLGAARPEIWQTSIAVLKDFWAFGAGLGSYPDIYALYENPSVLTTEYVRHANNDYLEWVIETGLVGVLLIAATLAFLADVTIRVWRKPGGADMRLKRAASVSLWIPFVMSLVDYPLRAPGIAVTTAIMLGIVMAPSTRKVTKKSKRRSRRVQAEDAPGTPAPLSGEVSI